MSTHRHVLKYSEMEKIYKCIACPLEYTPTEVEHLVNVDKYTYLGSKLRPDKDVVLEKLETDIKKRKVG